MIPFRNTVPYELSGSDVYLHECPFCETRVVTLKLKRAELQEIRDGKKRLVVFPCCGESITVIDADNDYLLADRPLRSE